MEVHQRSVTKPNDQTTKEPIKKKSSIHLQHGTLEAAKIPMSLIIATAVSMFFYTYSWPRDPRTFNMPLLGNRFTYVVVTALYILISLTWGPKWMENRDPIKPKKIMMAYNLFQVVLCSYMFVEAGLAGWFFDYNWKCQQEDRSYNKKTLRMVNVVYLYYLSKILDFTDTLFFILSKRWNHVSLLHVLHHSIMYLSAWHGIYFKPAGHLNFPVFINSGIHSLMYSYYFLSALGPSIQPYLWWKKYLTTIQIVQFVGVFAHTTQVFFRDCPDVSKVFAFLSCCYAVTFTYLFSDYYSQEYAKKKKEGTPFKPPTLDIGCVRDIHM